MTDVGLWKYRRTNAGFIFNLYRGRPWYAGAIGDFGAGPSGIWTSIFVLRP